MDVGEYSLPESINPNNFPAKLWRLVNNPASKAICWDSFGEVIIIDQQLFEKQILCPTTTSDNADAFKTANFSSFVRQLNLYGFRKAESATKDGQQTKRDSGTFHHFYNPNFRRNHPELVASLRRLTVDNKAKLQAGLNVNCRPPSRYQRYGGGDDGKDKPVKRVSAGTSVLSPTHQSTHPYYPHKALEVTSHSGTPAPPRYLIRGHGAALSPSVFTADKGMPVSLSHHYTGVASSSNAGHIQQGLLAHTNHGNANFTTFNPRNPQYPPGLYSPVCHCYHTNLVASPMTGSGLQTGLFSPLGYYQIADEVMQTPPSNSFVKVVTPEKAGPVLELSSNTCNTTLCDNPASTVKGDPLCAGPIIMAVAGNVELVTCGEQEESVVLVPEQMPEDAIFEVTSDDGNTEVEGVKVSESD
ncbi:heat shock factor protein 5 isoform X2 [Lates calcarifer]|uniref:Heat shock factor protein 5 isoform X2 n=1 Tax=Lates calcarifer TaxID=8187 RepID=A0AAJ7Q560_LATCA|nr:heat shock factor protein 5 isoform X2 [Lates calcarifer]